MKSLSLSLDQFAAERRGAQDRFVDELRAAVGKAIASSDYDDALAIVERQYREVYSSETSAPLNETALSKFMGTIEEALKQTTKDSKVEPTALMLALASLNAGTMAAADSDPEEIVLEWVTMADKKVRETHEDVQGQQRPAGEPFLVAGVKMAYPGDPTAPIELWINCRCVLRPAYSADFKAGKMEALKAKHLNSVRTELTAAAEGETEVTHAGIAVVSILTGRVFMAQRAFDETDDPEVRETWEFPGGGLDPGEDPQAGAFREFEEEVGDILPPGEIVNGWRSTNGVFQGFVMNTEDEFALDSWKPTEETQAVAWFSREMIAKTDNLRPEVRDQTDWDLIFGEEADMTVDTDTAPAPEVAPDEDLDASGDETPKDTRVPWHGVLAPDNVWSGDKRRFTNLGRTRDLPLPLTWQEKSAEGHDQNITVAMIEKVAMIDGLMHASGHFVSSVDEADKVIGLLAEFGRFGVSVDADDIGELQFDEETEGATFDDPRVCSACIVSIPAFAEAWVSLGLHPILDAVEPVEGEEEITDEALAAAAAPITLAAIEQFRDLAPGKTEDGPGWLTHPVDTDRLRDYWTHGAGAAKIAWGTPGDFNRCRVNLAEYVKPQYLNGYCANRHYDALHIWPGEHHSAKETITAALASGKEVDRDLIRDPAPAITLIASAAPTIPADYFKENDTLKAGACGVVIDEPDENGFMPTYGFIAEWGTCHIGVGGECTAPPHSETDYAYFATGEVLTDEGPVRVANLTAGIGHANPKMALKPAAAHYDNTDAVWADVAVGENEHGIWFAGVVRPFADEKLIYAARASGRLSGDWRKIRLTNGSVNFEMVGALSINVAGFPIPHAGLVAGAQVSLVAAGIVGQGITPEVEPETKPVLQIDTSQMSTLAALVVDEMQAREKRAATMAAIKAKVGI